MIFELPKHAIKAFMNLSKNDENILGDAVSIWIHYMESFATPYYLETGFNQFPDSSEFLTTKLWHGNVEYSKKIDARKVLLKDLFKGGFVIQYGVADRLVVEINANGDYTIREESVGRMRDWCWIDQGSRKLFLQGEQKFAHDYICDYINKQVSHKDLTAFIENTY